MRRKIDLNLVYKLLISTPYLDSVCSNTKIIYFKNLLVIPMLKVFSAVHFLKCLLLMFAFVENPIKSFCVLCRGHKTKNITKYENSEYKDVNIP